MTLPPRQSSTRIEQQEPVRLLSETEPLRQTGRATARQIAPGLHNGRSRVVFGQVAPELDGGAYAVKRVVGDRVTVSADLIADGHDVVAGELIVRPPLPVADAKNPASGGPVSGGPGADEHALELVVPLHALDADRHEASFEVHLLGRWQYTVRAWIDHYASWRRGFGRKLEAGQDVDVDLLIGAELVRAAAERAANDDRWALERAAAVLEDRSRPARERAQEALTDELSALMRRHPDRQTASELG